MIWLAALLALAEPPAPDCGRYRDGPDLQQCEFTRDEHNDVLEAGRRPPAAALGADAIRFSVRPELGGHAAIVEIVGHGWDRAEGRVMTFVGHPRWRWEWEDLNRFTLSAADYRWLAGEVDAAIAAWRPPPPADADGDEVGIVCMDGPGYVTERVRDGVVTSLVGFCPPTIDGHHPNSLIATILQAMFCARFERRFEVDLRTGRGCRQLRHRGRV